MKISSALVRKRREQRAWSQEQLAEVAGLSARTVQRIENGGGASPETRMALAAALDVTPAELCDRHDDAAAPVPRPAERRDGALRRGLRRYQVLIVGAAIVLLLLFGMAYQVGKDLARQQNRAECVDAGRTDCR